MLITIYEADNGWQVIVEGGGQGKSGEYSYNQSVVFEKGNYAEALQVALSYCCEGDEIRVNQSLSNFEYFGSDS